MIDKSFEEILASIKARISEGAGVDTSEGSYTDTLIRSTAMEIAEDYFEHKSLPAIVWPDENSGIYIDKDAARFGITRRSGIRASATVTFSGTDGVVVPAGTAVQTQSGLVYHTVKDAVVTAGQAAVAVTAERTGAEYNVAAGEIAILQSSAGVLLTDSTAAAGGIDDESDKALYARVLARKQKPITSGNAYHYEYWAMEVDGVGAVKVLPTWQGPGTVKVVVLDGNLEPPSDALVAAVAAHIEAQRPIGADVTVAAASRVALQVSAEVRLDAATTAGAVQTQLEALLRAYCKDLAFKAQAVVYHRVAYLLLSIPGVADYVGLTLNGGTENITLGGDAAPVVGEVAVVCAE